MKALCANILIVGGFSLGIWFVLEPGYYEDGAFGIRIENVVLVVPVKTKVSNFLFIYLKNFLIL